MGCFISIFFSTDSVACLSEYVTGDKIHWCGGNFGIAFAVLVHGQKIGSSQHSRKFFFFQNTQKSFSIALGDRIKCQKLTENSQFGDIVILALFQMV